MWAVAARSRYRTVDAGFLAADRDKRVAAGVLAGGVAYRFFFWVLAMSVLTNGALGFFDVQDVEAALLRRGVDPSVAASIKDLPPSDAARWWLVIVGTWLVLWSGYLGAQALILVHAAVWVMPPPRLRRALLASLTFTGAALAFIVSMALVRWLAEESRSAGIAATLALVIVPFTIWLLASRSLPHQDVGWMGLVPGAALVAVGLQGLYVVTVFYFWPKLENATELYGILGLVSTVLFWLYMAGRLVLGAATVNASLYEQRSRKPVDSA